MSDFGEDSKYYREGDGDSIGPWNEGDKVVGYCRCNRTVTPVVYTVKRVEGSGSAYLDNDNNPEEYEACLVRRSESSPLGNISGANIELPKGTDPDEYYFAVNPPWYRPTSEKDDLAPLFPGDSIVVALKADPRKNTTFEVVRTEPASREVKVKQPDCNYTSGTYDFVFNQPTAKHPYGMEWMGDVVIDGETYPTSGDDLQYTIIRNGKPQFTSVERGSIVTVEGGKRYILGASSGGKFVLVNLNTGKYIGPFSAADYTHVDLSGLSGRDRVVSVEPPKGV